MTADAENATGKRDLTRQVRGLQPGSQFLWCGHTVTVQRSAPVYTKRRGRLLFVVEDDGTERRLHYYDDELVALPAIAEIVRFGYSLRPPSDGTAS